jgi:5-formyltetrahydrofolate cyclo-ligase
MTSEECRILSNKIQNTVLELPEWKSAGNINIYKSIGNEVSTDKLIYDAETSLPILLYIFILPADFHSGNSKTVFCILLERIRHSSDVIHFL